MRGERGEPQQGGSEAGRALLRSQLVPGVLWGLLKLGSCSGPASRDTPEGSHCSGGTHSSAEETRGPPSTAGPRQSHPNSPSPTPEPKSFVLCWEQVGIRQHEPSPDTLCRVFRG